MLFGLLPVQYVSGRSRAEAFLCRSMQDLSLCPLRPDIPKFDFFQNRWEAV